MNPSPARTCSGLLLVLSAFLLVFLLPEVARAQEGAGVSDALVTTIVRSQFPDGIRFDIAVESPQQIVDVRLRYRVLGERATRYGRFDFEPTSRLENGFTVRTDTADRYIPPGVEIEYALEITDEDGLLTETEPQRFILLDPRFQWQRLDSPGGYIYYHGPQRDRAQRVLDAAQTTLTTMGDLMGVSDTGPLRMTMYNGVAEMQVALPSTSAVQEESLITEGVSFGDTGVILVLGSNPRVEGVTSHETVHFLVRHAIGNLSRIVPAWLNEGLAEYGNVEPGGSYDRALDFRLSDGTLMPLTSLTTVPGKPEDVILMYGEARSVVAYMVNTYGAGPLQKLLEGMRTGMSIDDGLTKAYGFDRTGLEAEWRVSIGAPPLEATPSRSALPTVIPRPTLVPFGVSTPTSVAQSLQFVDPPLPSPTPPSSGGCGRPVSHSVHVPLDIAGPSTLLLLGLLAYNRKRSDSPPLGSCQGHGWRVKSSLTVGRVRRIFNRAN